jgi:hypothetical protein
MLDCILLKTNKQTNKERERKKKIKEICCSEENFHL